MEVLGYILMIGGLVLGILTGIISLIKAYQDDVRGMGLVFAIFLYPWLLVIAVICAIISKAGEMILGM